MSHVGLFQQDIGLHATQAEAEQDIPPDEHE